ncbi:MAG: putative DNA-binding domain-containing protein [Sphingomonadales bacterium]|nr:putative DNA-binding domain-containing protein [Sphingomonadales bacterium]
MPAHRDLIAAFHAGLGSGALPPGLTAADPAEAGRRFAVYRNNVAHSLTRALATRYPVIERLVGGEYFTALAAVYLRDHPPRSPMLFEFGAEFPGFLAAFPPLRALPYLRDVARIEAARGRAYHAADAAPVAPARLAQAGAAPGAARLTLHPSVQIERAEYAARSIWVANQPGAAPVPEIDAARPEISLILRDPADRVLVLPLGRGDAALLGGLMRGASLLQAATEATAAHDPEHDPGAHIALLARAGAITDITLEPKDAS